MFPWGAGLAWVAYAVGGYGWCLMRGYDIPFRAWVSPLHPYQWPQGGPATIPDNKLFPGSPGPADNGGGGPIPVPKGGCPPGWTKIDGRCWPPPQGQF